MKGDTALPGPRKHKLGAARSIDPVTSARSCHMMIDLPGHAKRGGSMRTKHTKAVAGIINAPVEP